MDPARRARIEELLEGALDRPTAEREAWLAERCAGDRELREAVEALLAAHEASGGILDRGPMPIAAELVERARPPRPIGPYRILGELGRGGMSVVYRAERSDGHFRRIVALKVLRGELDAEELHARLATERQILAALDHPNIARLLDGGVTEEGRPYLVVEYVEGRTITDHCASFRLPLEERLRLAIEVARAVQHAHAHLVVHRDLKPSNILVTSEGRVRLLDFGIAKVLDVGAVDLEDPEVPRTGAGIRLFTPEYASPEQLRGEAAAVSHDVWGLGVVLFELLTGTRPFPGGRPARELEREILEEDPPRPSTVVRALHPDRVASLGSPPQAIARRLEGDLDRIVAMALRKEARLRYGSAEQFAEDLERHLAGLPVRAQADRRGYRVRKFLRRHRVEAGAAVAVLASLVIGAGAALWQAREARQERDRAEVAAIHSEAVAEYLLDLFRTADPWEVPAEQLTARELLARGERRLDALPDDPVLRARLLLVLGETYQSVGEAAAARPLLEDALELRREFLGEAHPATTDARLALGEWLRRQGRLAEAEAMAVQALAAARTGSGGGPTADPGREAAALDLLGFIHTGMGRTREALIDFSEEVELLRNARTEEGAEVGRALVNLAAVHRRLGRYDDAERLLREAIEQREQTFGPESPLAALTRARLGGLLAEHLARYAEAGELFQEALEVQTSVLGIDHPARGEALEGLGLVAERTGDPVRAEAYFREAIRTLESGLGMDHPNTVGSREVFAGFLGRSGRLDEAEQIFRETVVRRRQTLGSEHPTLAGSLAGFGRILLSLGRHDEAEEAFAEALGIREAVFGGEHALVGLTLVDLAEVYEARGERGERERLLRRALEILEAFHPPDHPELEGVRQRLVPVSAGS
jgi:eukaryotic-like serine/threonine-protein kinase